LLDYKKHLQIQMMMGQETPPPFFSFFGTFLFPPPRWGIGESQAENAWMLFFFPPLFLFFFFFFIHFKRTRKIPVQKYAPHRSSFFLFFRQFFFLPVNNEAG